MSADMHIAIFVDQHLDTLGGAQASVRLQRKYLEKLGHTVTICSPSSHNKLHDESFVITPSIPLAGGGEYHFTVPTKSVERRIDRFYDRLPAVDVVHVQGDYWGAILGLSFAKRHDAPVVITFHNNVYVGIYKTMGRSAGRLFIRLMSLFAKRFVSGGNIGDRADAWDYLHNLALHAQALLAPTQHFADTLVAHGVANKVGVVSNGIDDDLLESTKRPSKKNEVPVFVWSGRMSREKRLLLFLEAVRLSNIPVEFKIYGDGDMYEPARRFIAKHKMGAHVKLHHAVTLKQALKVYASADALVQTSVGFETQGMSVFEALSLGTPVVLSDPLIAQSFPKRASWVVPDSSVESLAATMNRAYQDIISGNRKNLALSGDYDHRQSLMTEKVLKVYKEVIKVYRGGAPKA